MGFRERRQCAATVYMELEPTVTQKHLVLPFTPHHYRCKHKHEPDPLSLTVSAGLGRSQHTKPNHSSNFQVTSIFCDATNASGCHPRRCPRHHFCEARIRSVLATHKDHWWLAINSKKENNNTRTTENALSNSEGLLPVTGTLLDTKKLPNRCRRDLCAQKNSKIIATLNRPKYEPLARSNLGNIIVLSHL